jgi:hypothetical protein
VVLPERVESDQVAGFAAAFPLPVEQEPLLPKVFQLDKSRSKELRSWMALQKPSESNQLRENFSPTFEKSSFDLKVPKLDPLMASGSGKLKVWRPARQRLKRSPWLRLNSRFWMSPSHFCTCGEAQQRQP